MSKKKSSLQLKFIEYLICLLVLVQYGPNWRLNIDLTFLYSLKAKKWHILVSAAYVYVPH